MANLLAIAGIKPNLPTPVFQYDNNFLSSCQVGEEEPDKPPHANFYKNELNDEIEDPQWDWAIFLEEKLNLGEKLVFVHLQDIETIFELYQLIEPNTAEKINEFCVSALLDKQLTVYTDFDIILFVLGIKEKEAYLIFKQTNGYLFKNLANGCFKYFIKYFCLNKFEESTGSLYLEEKAIRMCYNSPRVSHLNNLSLRNTTYVAFPKPLENYESKPNLMGIDFGTTHVCSTISRNGRIDILPIDKSGNTLIPAAIYFGEKVPIVGNVALTKLRDQPHSVIYSPKIVPSFGSELSFGYILGSMVQNRSDEPVFFVKNSEGVQKVPLKEVLVLLMQTVQNAATEYQTEFNDKKKINQAVITVPQWTTTSEYENLWIKALIEAAMELEIELLDIIPEVYAGFLSHLSNYDVEDGQNILIIDCGGGRTAFQGFRVVEKHGCKQIMHLSHPNSADWQYTAEIWGGVHFENKIVEKLLEILWERFKINPMKTSKSRYNLFLTVEKIKYIITHDSPVTVELSEFDPKMEDVNFVVTKEMVDEMFEDEMAEHYSKLLLPWKQKHNFDVVFLAGGTNRIRILQEIVKKQFLRAKIILDGQVEITTAIGATIHGLQLLNGETEPFADFKRFKNFIQTDDKDENTFLKPNLKQVHIETKVDGKFEKEFI